MDAINQNSTPTLDRKYRLQFEEAQDGWVLLYPEGMVKLNPSAAEILKRCDGEHTITQVVAELQTAFEQDNLTEEVNSFLQIAKDQQWIQLNEPT